VGREGRRILILSNRAACRAAGWDSAVKRAASDLWRQMWDFFSYLPLKNIVVPTLSLKK
jgi:hypothetical protein